MRAQSYGYSSFFTENGFRKKILKPIDDQTLNVLRTIIILISISVYYSITTKR